MACKRTATSDLNHDNWNRDEEPEEAGKFATASQEILEKRVVRTAKRRLPNTGESSTKSAFSGFTGFKTLSTPPTTSAFSFLSNINSTSNTIAQTSSTLSTATPVSSDSFQNGISRTSTELPGKPVATEKNDTKIFKKSSDYFSKLRGLNESVTQWIRTHVESNPFCILTPIFRDYERYLKEIEAQHGDGSSKTSETVEKKLDNENSQNNTLESTVEINKLSSDSKSTLDDTAATTKSIFDSGKSIFANKNNPMDNPFLNKPSSEKGDNDSGLGTKSLSFPTSNASTFSFGQTTNTSASTTAGFSFGGTKPFTFSSNVVVPQNSETKDDDDEPPKVEIKPVTEDGAIYEKRCKVFIKKEGVFGDRGVGVLFLKPTPHGKTQLIVRAENSLGNLLLNTLLTQSIPTKRMNEKTVMIVCLPLADSQPPPSPVLLRVKTSEDADSLLEALDKNKK